MRPRKERIVNNFLTVTVYAHYRFIDIARIRSMQCLRNGRASVRPSVSHSVGLSHLSTAVTAAGGFAAERPAGRSYRSIAGAGMHSAATC